MSNPGNSPQTIHWCHWAGHSDIGIKCGEWTEVAWGADAHKGLPKGVYRADSGSLYTFDKELATCEDCKR